VQNGPRTFASALLLTPIAAGLSLAAGHAGQVHAAPKGKPNSIEINYVAPKSVEHRRVYTVLKEQQALEKIRDLLSPLRLPHRLLLETRDCDGVANALSNDESVIVCYEYLDELWKKAPEKTTPAGVAPIDALVGPFVDVFLHEAGHATFSMLQTPLFGREEDAADQFSTYIMLRLDKQEARRLILGSAYQYKGDLTSPTVTMAREAFADEHGTPAQRFFNLLCVAYGSDPKLFADVVKKEFLPEDRAVSCKREFIQVSHSFDALIRPHIDKRLARQLHKSWLPPIDTKPMPWRGAHEVRP
jgi:hypothetical protein